jgi:hypothetical protein
VSRDGRSVVVVIARAALLFVAVAVGAHVVYRLLAPLLPALVAISFVMALAYWLIIRR